MEFLAEQNPAGQTLLQLVSRGNAIIAELLRLSSYVPRAFVRPFETWHTDIIFDFKYRSNETLYDSKIEDDPELFEHDSLFKELNLDILGRFYTLFESIFKYARDLQHYISEVEDGVFIQLTIETILQDDSGKQLLCEAFYLYCVILTLMDTLIEGPVRERLIMSYLRYKGAKFMPLLDDVCKICGSTGYTAGGKRPPNYPEFLFARYPLQAKVISMVLGRLRTDDIYNQITKAFPQPEHRSIALAKQASMIYMILYLAPNILHSEFAVMREIVDKHFPDNWVIPYYLGYTVDLSIEWDRYKAAKAAIANTVNMNNVQTITARYWNSVGPLTQELAGFLREGVLIEEYILDHIVKLLNCARNCNVTLRWLMLHMNSQNKKISQVVVGKNNLIPIIGLLMDTAQFEWILDRFVTMLLEQKGRRWDDHRREASEHMNELGEFFSGTKELTRVKPNKHLEKWFHDIANQINSLDYNDSVAAGRKIQQLIQALEEVEQFHQIETSLQVKQFLIDTRGFLQQMLRIVNISPKVKVTMALIADISYGWEIVRTEDYVCLLQEHIKRDPTLVLKLRSVVVKLSSILILTAMRIDQSKSPDLMSVSAYYSGELLEFVRKALEIIPATVFNLLQLVISLTRKMKELPTKLDKDKVKEFAQLDDRFKLAQTTHSISVFTEGILAMESEETFVGVIKVDATKLLEDGIRKELVARLSKALHEILDFKTGKIEELFQQLQKLSDTLDGHCRSFQYIQDYIRMQGLKIWQEEFMRIINFNVEQECNKFLQNGIDDSHSIYQSREIPIPIFRPTDERSINFIGRLGRELLAHTDFRATTYVDTVGSWFDNSSGKELVSSHTFVVLLDGVSVFGLNGLDQLYCFMIVREMKNFFKRFERPEAKDLVKALLAMQDSLHPISAIFDKPKYEPQFPGLKNLWPYLLEVVCLCGQIQLIRRHLASTLTLACKSDSTLLACTLDTFNKSLLKDIQAHYKDPLHLPYPEPDSPLLPELSTYLEAAGNSDPYSKLYVTSKPLPIFSELVYLFILSQLKRFVYNPTFGSLVWQKKDKNPHDMKTFAVGVVTLLKQIHVEHTHRLISYICQKIRTLVNSTASDPKQTEYPVAVVSLVHLLALFLKYSNIQRSLVESQLPSLIFDSCKISI